MAYFALAPCGPRHGARRRAIIDRKQPRGRRAHVASRWSAVALLRITADRCKHCSLAASPADRGIADSRTMRRCACDEKKRATVEAEPGGRIDQLSHPVDEVSDPRFTFLQEDRHFAVLAMAQQLPLDRTCESSAGVDLQCGILSIAPASLRHGWQPALCPFRRRPSPLCFGYRFAML